MDMYGYNSIIWFIIAQNQYLWRKAPRLAPSSALDPPATGRDPGESCTVPSSLANEV